MNLFKQIENDIKSKKLSPIYLLMGEEEFYIDYLTNLITENSISKSEKEFKIQTNKKYKWIKKDKIKEYGIPKPINKLMNEL